MAEGKKFTYDCRDEGFNCDWQYADDNESQLNAKVQAHIKEYHSQGNAADKCGK
ncbi:MAG: DUF1059 domain-containing protein [Chloroflexi bacterium]|jgi:predicted small metal-binding protein|nr:DUF1059 domain-containing protein [Chloroflexota bacterium]MBT7081495.1 DUF1059 domain-containing protein [Chloroflexota bacterium]MBT7290703.1 DUF1059 domain-containing protein [Chloroflexota bacterium]